MILHTDVGRQVPRIKDSLKLKLAEIKLKIRRSKKSLDGLCEVLAPVSTVIKTNEQTSILKEPGKKEVMIRNSDLAKFGTIAARQTDLKC